jgi:hypothetical protein
MERLEEGGQRRGEGEGEDGGSLSFWGLGCSRSRAGGQLSAAARDATTSIWSCCVQVGHAGGDAREPAASIDGESARGRDGGSSPSQLRLRACGLKESGGVDILKACNAMVLKMMRTWLMMGERGLLGDHGESSERGE